MKTYIIKRILLMIPTFFGMTLVYFSVIQAAPGGPVEQKVYAMRMGNANGGGAEGGAGAELSGSSAKAEGEARQQFESETIKQLNELYGFDKPIFQRYLLWLGFWPREIDKKKLSLKEYSRLIVGEEMYNGKSYSFQKWIYVDINDQGEFEVYQSPTAVDIAFANYKALPKAETLKKEDWKLSEMGWHVDVDRSRTKIQDEKLETCEETFKKDEKKVKDSKFENSPQHVGESKEDYKARQTKEKQAFDAEKLTKSQANKEKLDNCAKEVTEEKAKIQKELEVCSAMTNPKEARLCVNKVEEERYYLYRLKFLGIFQGYFGDSYSYREPVMEVFFSKVHISIYFGFISFVISYLVFIPLGVSKALKHKTLYDGFTSFVILFLRSVPPFVVGLILLLTFAVHWPIFPLGDFRPKNWDELTTMQKILGQIHHTILPIIVWNIGGFAASTLTLKNYYLEELGADYVRTAFAKGLTENRVLYIHVFRNAFYPMVQGITGILSLMFVGSMLIEKTFNIQGVGYLTFNAMQQRDYPISLGIMVLSSIIGMIAGLIGDLLLAVIDPRVRFD